MPDSNDTHKNSPDASTAADSHVLDGVVRPAATRTQPPPGTKRVDSVALLPGPLADGNKPEAHSDKPVAVKRIAKQDLARQVIEAVQGIFANGPNGQEFLKGMTWEEAMQQAANWLSALPTGGEGPGPDRFWPEDFNRPNTTGWVKPS